MKKRRTIAMLMCIVLTIMIAPISVYADGDGNIDSGGGGMGNGSSSNYWSGGYDGVRVSVVDSHTDTLVATPIDITNKTITSGIVHFGKVSKIQYKNGTALSPSVGGYSYENPTNDMPRIVSGTVQGATLEEIKEYFCSSYSTRAIASYTNIAYEQLISGNYKLLLEPMAYFVYESTYYAMTATEAALYNQIVNGGLRSKVPSLTHQNLPLSMFLERSDLGFSAWDGATTGKQSDGDIINYLGMGIVSYTEDPPEISDYNVTYRVNTDVITAVTLSASEEITPKNPASVTFSVGNSTYTMSGVVIPEGGSQLVWCRWHTPDTPQTVTIRVSTNKGYLSDQQIVAKVVDLEEKEPPDPKATERNNSFTFSSVPNKTQTLTNSWGVWSAYWHPYWVWISDWDWCSHSTWVATEDGGYWDSWGHWVDNGYWEDKGWWVYEWTGYSANLNASADLTVDSKNPTANGDVMKSGYGVNLLVVGNVERNAPSFHVTGVQTAVTYFPEFKYKKYWRLMERTVSGYSARFEFKKNEYSTYNNRTHFTPVWFPDGSYQTYTYLEDVWTPAGMLSVNLTDSLTIRGNVYGDWHISPMN